MSENINQIDRFKNLKHLLDEKETWPCQYLFKFIVSAESISELQLILKDFPLSLKKSETGKYISVTTEVKMNSSDDIISIYEKTSKIAGLIAL